MLRINSRRTHMTFNSQPHNPSNINSDKAPQIKQLHRFLQTDNSLLSILGELLTQEKNSLVSKDIDTLNAVIEKKKMRLIELDKNQKNEQLLLKPYHTDTKQHPVEEFISSLPAQQNQQIIKTWHTVKDTIKKINDMNAQNGQIINRSLRVTEQLLDIFKGAEKNQTVYQQQGKTQKNTYQQTIAKA